MQVHIQHKVPELISSLLVFDKDIYNFYET